MRHLYAVLLGALFGGILVKAEVLSWFRIQEMFWFQSFHMYGIIGSAIVVGVISLQVIKRLEAKSISGDLINPADKKFNKKGNLISAYDKEIAAFLKKGGKIKKLAVSKKEVAKAAAEFRKSHKKMTQNYVCVHGKVKLVLYDDREKSVTKGKFFFLEKNNKNTQMSPHKKSLLLK